MSTPWGWGSLASGPPPSWWKSPPSGPPPGQRPGHGRLFQLTTSRLGVQDPIPGSTLDDTASLVNESFLLICLTITSQCVPHLLVLGRGLISTGVFFLPTIPGYFFYPQSPRMSSSLHIMTLHVIITLALRVRVMGIYGDCRGEGGAQARSQRESWLR